MTKKYHQFANFPNSLVDAGVREHYPRITDEDIDNGYIMRYFGRQTNHLSGDILEIDRHTFERLKSNSLWKTISMKWRIAGPLDDIPGPQKANSPTRLYTGVITANTITLEEADTEIPGMKYKILNNTQFWIGQ